MNFINYMRYEVGGTKLEMRGVWPFQFPIGVN